MLECSGGSNIGLDSEPRRPATFPAQQKFPAQSPTRWTRKRSMAVENIELLKNLPVFQSIGDDDLQKLAGRALIVAHRKGDIIVRENEADDAFYVVVTGRCQATTRLKSGARRVITHYTTGDCFGEIALLAGEKYWFTVRCLNDTVLLKITRGDFDQIVRHSPGFLYAFHRTLQERIQFLREERKRGKWSTVFAVYGVHRGVGKGLLSANLAASLHAETQEPVLVVDMNCRDECLTLQRFENLLHWRTEDVSGLVRKHPVGYDVLPLRLEGTDSEANLIAPFFGNLVKRYDYVLIDLPEGLTPPIQQSLVQADETFIITGREEENLYRTRLLLGELDRLGVNTSEKARVILTRASDDQRNGIEEIQRHIGHAVHCHVRRIPEADQSSAEVKRPFVLDHPAHPFSLVVTRLARELGNVRVGLALGSGAARGLAHIGVIRVLEKAGLIVDVVSGASMGALIAAAWASGKSADEMEQIAMQVQGKRAFFNLLDFSWTRGGLIKGKKIEAFLEQFLGHKTFADTYVDLRIVATDLNTTEEVVMSEGRLVDAVRASIAIPGVITPVRNNGHLFIDGGISSPVPIGVLERMGVARIIAVNTIPDVDLMREYHQIHDELDQLPQEHRQLYDTFRRTTRWYLDNNIMDINMRAMHAMQSQIANRACANADVVIRPVFFGAAWYEFYKPRQFIRKGEETTRAVLPALQKLVGKPDATAAAASPPV